MANRTLIPGSRFRIDTSNWAKGQWYEREALKALQRGHCHAIPDRDNDGLYLLRLWLTPPQLGHDNGWESGDSLLLHHFYQNDDDAALHDHPWDFRTTILAGCYKEHLPPATWRRGSKLGPAWNENIIMRKRGESVERKATDLHCVGWISPCTWTLVRTSQRIRPWGFHPEGQPWTPRVAYLRAHEAAAKAKQAA